MPENGQFKTQACSLIRHRPLPLDRANQAAAKTVRGQPCRLGAPSCLRRARGQAPKPLQRSASAPLPIRAPFFLPANGKRRRWPVQNFFSEARSLAALTHSKKVLDGHPSAFAKTIPSMRKKGEEKRQDAEVQDSCVGKTGTLLSR
jgi:hypothetical protein